MYFLLVYWPDPDLRVLVSNVQRRCYHLYRYLIQSILNRSFYEYHRKYLKTGNNKIGPGSLNMWTHFFKDAIDQFSPSFILGIFSQIFLGRKMQWFKWVGILLVISGLVTVGVNDVISQVSLWSMTSSVSWVYCQMTSSFRWVCCQMTSLVRWVCCQMMSSVRGEFVLITSLVRWVFGQMMSSVRWVCC